MFLLKKSESSAAKRRIPLRLVDSTDFNTPETGLTFSAAEVQVSKAGGGEANSAGAVVEIAGGNYYYQATAAELDTDGMLLVRVVKTGVAPFTAACQVVSFDPYDAVKLGLSIFPANLQTLVVDPTNGWLYADVRAIKGDPDFGTTDPLPANVITANGEAVSGLAALQTVASINNGVITAAAIAAGAITNAKIADGAITAAKVADGTLTPAKFNGVFPDNFVSALIDADGVLTASVNYAQPVPSGTIPDGTMGDVFRKIDNRLPDAGVLATVTDIPTADAIATVVLNGVPTANTVAAAVLDGVVPEPTAVPAAAGTLRQKIGYLFAKARNRRTQTSSTETIFRDDGMTPLSTSAKSDDGTTFVKGEDA